MNVYMLFLAKHGCKFQSIHPRVISVVAISKD